MKKFENKVVLITGGTMGIGKELALQVLNAGGKAVLTGRSEARCRAVEEEFSMHSSNLLVVISDLADTKQHSILVDSIRTRFGKLDFVLMNAAMSAYGTLESTSMQVIDEILSINLNGTISLIKQALPELIQSKGGVLFVSSIAAFYGLPEYSLYALTKRAIGTFAESLRLELHHKGVFVGVAYLSFTENDQQKRTLDPNGNPEPVPQRSKLLVNSREKTARLLLKQIVSRKRVHIHSIFGKFVFVLASVKPLMFILQKRMYAKKIG